MTKEGTTERGTRGRDSRRGREEEEGGRRRKEGGGRARE
jgi:hypothetical protein